MVLQKSSHQTTNNFLFKALLAKALLSKTLKDKNSITYSNAEQDPSQIPLINFI